MDPRAEAVVANLLGLFGRFRALPQVDDVGGDDVSAQSMDVPFPMFNAVAGARFGEDARGRTREVAGYYLRRRRPFLWWVDPAPGSPTVAAVLLEMGLQSVPVVGMHVGLGRSSGGGEHGFESVSAADPRFVDLVMTAFEMPETVREPLLGTSHALDPDAVHLLAHVDGRPVACGSGVASGGTWGLYNIATLPDFRGRGLGSGIVAALLAAGREHGCRGAVLHASPMGLSVYRQAGFEPVVELTQYVWPG